MPEVSIPSVVLPTSTALHPLGALGGGALLNASWSGCKTVVVAAVVTVRARARIRVRARASATVVVVLVWAMRLAAVSKDEARVKIVS